MPALGASMTRSMLLLIALFFAVSPGTAGAQTLNPGTNNSGSLSTPGNQQGNLDCAGQPGPNRNPSHPIDQPADVGL